MLRRPVRLCAVGFAYHLRIFNSWRSGWFSRTCSVISEARDPDTANIEVRSQRHLRVLLNPTARRLPAKLGRVRGLTAPALSALRVSGHGSGEQPYPGGPRLLNLPENGGMELDDHTVRHGHRGGTVDPRSRGPLGRRLPHLP